MTTERAGRLVKMWESAWLNDLKFNFRFSSPLWWCLIIILIDWSATWLLIQHVFNALCTHCVNEYCIYSLIWCAVLSNSIGKLIFICIQLGIQRNQIDLLLLASRYTIYTHNKQHLWAESSFAYTQNANANPN